ncbi:hypothetical protein MRX96_056589 [Rhipicephalus microplus]
MNRGMPNYDKVLFKGKGRSTRESPSATDGAGGQRHSALGYGHEQKRTSGAVVKPLLSTSSVLPLSRPRQVPVDMTSCRIVKQVAYGWFVSRENAKVVEVIALAEFREGHLRAFINRT